MNNYKKTRLCLMAVLFGAKVFAQINVEVNANTKHQVGGISTFDRSKYVTVHSTNYEPDWNGQNGETSNTPARLFELTKTYDAWLSRETGAFTRAITGNSASKIASQSLGASEGFDYTFLADRFAYEEDQDLVVAAQEKAYEVFNHNGFTWGNRAAAWVKKHGNGGTTGRKRPSSIEILNEPVFPLVDFIPAGATPEPLGRIFRFHRDAANTFKQNVPANGRPLVGGWTTAFPQLDKRNFAQWNERWKQFIDIAGGSMDFYSLHLYDQPIFGSNNSQWAYRKGGNIEATLDQIENYGFITGKKKPFLISEYGSQLNNNYRERYNAQRDWWSLRSMNAMMLQFMERPDQIVKAIPFVPIKAEWAYGLAEGSPVSPGVGFAYSWRLMKNNNEPNGTYWVNRNNPFGPDRNVPNSNYSWTELIRYYQLWSDVRGTRVDSKQADVNLQVDSYVNGKDLYIIVNNLYTQGRQFNLNIKGTGSNPIEYVFEKHLFPDANGNPNYNTRFVGTNKATTLSVGSEGTVVLRYHFKNNINVNQTSNETKHYANRNASSYLEYIGAGENNSFNINIGNKPSFGEATLRIGVGRPNARVKLPRVWVNGTEINSAKQWRGSGVGQGPRGFFHSIVEVDVPLSALKANGNNIIVRYPDEGGFISSMAMQVFRMTAQISRGTGTNAQAPVTTTPPSSGVPVGQVISLRKSGGDRKFLSAVAELGNSIYANQSQVFGNRQKFRVVNHPNGGVALFNLNSQRYIQVVGDNQNAIVRATGADTKGWERFEWINVAAGQVALKSLHTGKYLQGAYNVDNSAIFPRGSERKGWETFIWKVEGAGKSLDVTGEAATLLYPNPVNEGESVTIANSVSGSIVSIFDVKGNLVNSIKAEEGISTIETSNLAIGVYFVQVGNQDAVKLIVE